MWIKGTDLTEEQRNQIVCLVFQILYFNSEDRIWSWDIELNKFRYMSFREWIDQRALIPPNDNDYWDERASIGPVIYAEPAYHKLKHTGLFR